MWGVAGLSRSLSFKDSSAHSVNPSTSNTNNPVVWKDMNGMDKLGVLEVDPSLAAHETHLKYRAREYMKRKMEIEKYEGSLQSFARGYEKFGFNREGNCILYREWAPAATAAQLVGEFNGWEGSRHSMERDKFGVWSIRLPDEGGRPAIAHGSKLKFRMQKGDGEWVDRIPAWIKYAVADPTVFAATYDGVYWDPPASEKYQFKHARPDKPAAPLIYEAHVGMSSKEPRVAGYREFADDVLPRVKRNHYNTVQLMAVMEHAYYGCFGYHVTSLFAVSSRSGTPEDLKYLIDTAHSLGLRVLIDVVHSHVSTNQVDGLAGFDVGQAVHDSYFHVGARGYHSLWDSRLLHYAHWEVQRLLLSNLSWWLTEYHFDGFRFDGVTSMLYHHHGIGRSFTGNYHEYFSEATDVAAGVYLMLANDVVHELRPDATVLGEDVSGMPTLCRPVAEGGLGFDFRLAMGIPDLWIRLLTATPETPWPMADIVHELANRRHREPCVAYAESHDQSLVGDQAYAYMLMDTEMFHGMSTEVAPSEVVERGVALHKMIHFVTMALGGEGYLNFMGNEFGHPEWIDFPRLGNNWSFERCRRQWDLVDHDQLRYKFLNGFNGAMLALEEEFQFVSSEKQVVSCASEPEQLIVFERGDLVFVFNFHPTATYSALKVGCAAPGTYRICLDSDAAEFGGRARVDHDAPHPTSEGDHNQRPHSFTVTTPSRTSQVYYKVPK